MFRASPLALAEAQARARSFHRPRVSALSVPLTGAESSRRARLPPSGAECALSSQNEPSIAPKERPIAQAPTAHGSRANASTIRGADEARWEGLYLVRRSRENSPLHVHHRGWPPIRRTTRQGLVRKKFGWSLAFPRAMMQELVDVDCVGSGRNDALRGEEHYAALRGNEVLSPESMRSILSGVGVSIVVLAVFEISSTTAARSACSTKTSYSRADSLRS
jgi:hypothetical protein